MAFLHAMAGAQTALSYGVSIDFNDPDSVAAGRKALAEAIPAVAHPVPTRPAAIDGVWRLFLLPRRASGPVSTSISQDPDDLIWIRWAIPGKPRVCTPKIIVHGHTPVS